TIAGLVTSVSSYTSDAAKDRDAMDTPTAHMKCISIQRTAFPADFNREGATPEHEKSGKKKATG
ncbi:hypothetical protein, partial [Pseudomonas caspiana]|uniref:hypothetical protein n=1 Tax=Pseudomonas caspiana TaxID=1451454 RepID=UPI001EE6F77C